VVLDTTHHSADAAAEQVIELLRQRGIVPAR
jgi:predicted deacylase